MKAILILFRTSTAIALTLILCSCANPRASTRMNQVRVGMTKSEVSKALPQPESTSANGPVEILRYRLEAQEFGWQMYFVELHDGTVTRFGLLGDWDSALTPKDRKEIEVKFR